MCIMFTDAKDIEPNTNAVAIAYGYTFQAMESKGEPG